jgi:Zn-dependent protease with chaperone function
VKCPSCGADLTENHGYVVWCEACEWNVDPRPAEPKSKREQRRQERVARRGDALFAELSSKPDLTANLSTRAVVIFAAALVHALTLTLIVVGAWLALQSWPEVGVSIIGALLFLLGLTVLPRLGRVPRDAVVLVREDGPAIFGLVDRVSSPIGARPPDVIVVDNSFNASYGKVGLRRRRVLTIGKPLWFCLTPVGKAALLGHEVGHDVNGDIRRGMFVRGATASLRMWGFLLRPQLQRARRVHGGSFQGFAVLAELLTNLLLAPISALVMACSKTMSRLGDRIGVVAEYRADALSAKVASTSAAVAALEVLQYAPSIAIAIQHARARGDRRPAEEIARERLESLPLGERTRLRRAAARKRLQVDSTHPPTHQRIELLRTRPAQPGLVHLTEVDTRAADAEIRASATRH